MQYKLEAATRKIQGHRICAGCRGIIEPATEAHIVVLNFTRNAYWHEDCYKCRIQQRLQRIFCRMKEFVARDRTWALTCEAFDQQLAEGQILRRGG